MFIKFQIFNIFFENLLDGINFHCIFIDKIILFGFCVINET